MVHFAEKNTLLIDRFPRFFAKSRKSVEEVHHPKEKIGPPERPRSLNPDKAIAMAICPFIVHLITYN